MVFLRPVFILSCCGVFGLSFPVLVVPLFSRVGGFCVLCFYGVSLRFCSLVGSGIGCCLGAYNMDPCPSFFPPVIL